MEDDETYDLDEELQIAIRRAKLSDLDEIYELEKVCFHTGKGRFEKHEIEEWLENSAATFFVVESVENDLIGYGLYQEFDEDAPDAEIVELAPAVMVLGDAVAVIVGKVV